VQTGDETLTPERLGEQLRVALQRLDEALQALLALVGFG